MKIQLIEHRRWRWRSPFAQPAAQAQDHLDSRPQGARTPSEDAHRGRVQGRQGEVRHAEGQRQGHLQKEAKGKEKVAKAELDAKNEPDRGATSARCRKPRPRPPTTSPRRSATTRRATRRTRARRRPRPSATAPRPTIEQTPDAKPDDSARRPAARRRAQADSRSEVARWPERSSPTSRRCASGPGSTSRRAR